LLPFKNDPRLPASLLPRAPRASDNSALCYALTWSSSSGELEARSREAQALWLGASSTDLTNARALLSALNPNADAASMAALARAAATAASHVGAALWPGFIARAAELAVRSLDAMVEGRAGSPVGEAPSGES
jgi:hypothetical protein